MNRFKAEVRATVQTDKEGQYHIQDSGSGSWLIGTDVYSTSTSDAANGFVKGISGCPPVLEIPGTLEDKEGNTKPVEIIGRGAFVYCGCYESCSQKYGQTKILKVPRQVKVIKYRGLGVMNDLVSFEIEAGSVLQTIDNQGLFRIGATTGTTPSKRNTTLILPSTLSSVYRDGIYCCNLFHTIIYCGKHSLTYSSDLETDSVSDTVVKVTNRYPSDSQIFGRTPSRTTDSEAEAERLCKGFLGQPTTEFTTESFEDGCEVTGWTNGVEKCPIDNITIPEEIDGKKVLSVKESAFKECPTAGPISLPRTLKRVGALAFANTTKVTAVSLGTATGLEEIGESAFCRCGAETEEGFPLVLLSGVTVSENAFAEANVVELDVLVMV